MKRINLHFIAIAITLITLFIFNQNYGKETFVFFGFAENKEMEIRLEHAVTIEQVYVTGGKNVKKGELLLEVKRSGMALTQSDLNHEIARLESQLKLWESGLKGSINRLTAQKIAKENEITSQIEQLESEMAINQSLIDGLQSINTSKDKDGRSPGKLRIEGLKKELQLVGKPLNAEINKLNQELYAKENPIKIQIEKLREELGFVHQDEKKLQVFAQSDGVVGNIYCKVGEQLSAFSTLIVFYEANPTEVKAYVLESLILNVNMGDSIQVQSSVKSDYKCTGEVIGMGSRIVEIPERLRKNPTFKTYGREVQVRIPSSNKFMQKEKVTLKPVGKHKEQSSQNSNQASTTSTAPTMLNVEAKMINSK